MSFGSQPGDPLPWAEATGNASPDDPGSADAGGASNSTPAVSAPGAVAPCVQCEITSLTVMTEPADRTRTDIGVGERVTLTFSLGNATWTKSSSQGRLSSDSGTSIVFTAPSTPQSVTITATGGGCTATIDFTIVKPIEIRAIVRATLHNQNTTSIGMWTRMFLAPFNVNFHWVEEIEDEVMATATGVYACFDNTGHSPSTTPSSFTTGIAHGYGTRCVDQDEVTCPGCDGGTTQGDGRAALRIPQKWRVKGTTSWHDLLPANQIFTSTAAGDLQARKSGAFTTGVTFASPGSNFPSD